MNEHDQQVSSVEATANPAPSQGRRRLVKGAIFAVPAIVTLRRASAQFVDPQNSIWCTVAQIPKTKSVFNTETKTYEDVPEKDGSGNIIMEDDPEDSCLLSLNNRELG